MVVKMWSLIRLTKLFSNCLFYEEFLGQLFKFLIVYKKRCISFLSIRVPLFRRQLHLSYCSSSSVSCCLNIYYLNLTICFCRITFLESKAPDTGNKLNVHRGSEDALDIFWTSCVRSIYVLCPGVTSQTFVVFLVL